MKKFIAAAVLGFFIFFAPGADVGGDHQLVASAADDDYQVRLGMTGVLITYDNKPQTWEYQFIRKIFKDELGQVLSQKSADLPEGLFKVHIKESLDDQNIGEPIIAVSLDGQPICWVKISQLGTPEQMRGFARFSSKLIFRRLQELANEKSNGKLPAGNPKKKISL